MERKWFPKKSAYSSHVKASWANHLIMKFCSLERESKKKRFIHSLSVFRVCSVHSLVIYQMGRQLFCLSWTYITGTIIVHMICKSGLAQYWVFCFFVSFQMLLNMLFLAALHTPFSVPKGLRCYFSFRQKAVFMGKGHEGGVMDLTGTSSKLHLGRTGCIYT